MFWPLKISKASLVVLPNRRFKRGSPASFFELRKYLIFAIIIRKLWKISILPQPYHTLMVCHISGTPKIIYLLIFINAIRSFWVTQCAFRLVLMSMVIKLRKKLNLLVSTRKNTLTIMPKNSKNLSPVSMCSTQILFVLLTQNIWSGCRKFGESSKAIFTLQVMMVGIVRVVKVSLLKKNTPKIKVFVQIIKLHIFASLNQIITSVLVILRMKFAPKSKAVKCKSCQNFARMKFWNF